MLYNALKITRFGSKGAFCPKSYLHTTATLEQGGRRPRKNGPLVTKGSSRTKLGNPLGHSAHSRWRNDNDNDGGGRRDTTKSRNKQSEPWKARTGAYELSAQELYKRASAQAAKGIYDGSVVDEWDEPTPPPKRTVVRRGDPESVKSLAEATGRRLSFGLASSRTTPFQDPRASRIADSRPRTLVAPDDSEDVQVAQPDSRHSRSPTHAPVRDPPTQLPVKKNVEQHSEDELETTSDMLEKVFARPMNPAQRQQFKESTPGSSKRPLPAAFTHTPLVPPPSVSPSSSRLTSFTSPPLMPALLTSIVEVLGPDTKPTIIQQLALTNLMRPKYSANDAPFDSQDDGWIQALLASETGSGKTIAYLLPLLQNLKHVERHGPAPPPLNGPARQHMPRALVLAPTHELSRQLASSAKSLSHVAKLRVLCTSRANQPHSGGVGSVLRSMTTIGERVDPDAEEGEIVITRNAATMAGLGKPSGPAHPIDVATGTPKGLLEMVRGNGWERGGEILRDENGQLIKKWRIGEPTMSVERVEWVVIDEADILLDPDFRDYTLGLLDDIAKARAHVDQQTHPGALPFHLLLNSATIPGLLNSTIEERWPRMQRLASPGVHRLPAGMHTQHVRGTGNRMADVADRIKRIWADDGMNSVELSKILVFVNKNTRAAELSSYLSGKGIANIALTGLSGRVQGSNRHLGNFVKRDHGSAPLEDDGVDVLVTTSLLSRGLDFSPRVRHVLFLDEPRNVVDLLHRAGRSARAGNEGTLTVFGGKGSRGARDIASRVRALESKPSRNSEPQESEETPSGTRPYVRRHNPYRDTQNRRPMRHA